MFAGNLAGRGKRWASFHSAQRTSYTLLAAVQLVGTTSGFCPPYVKPLPHRRRPIPLARAGSNGLPQDCAERIEDSHAQDADLSESRAVSEGRVRRRLGRAVWHGVSSSPGSPFLWVLSFGDAKESTPPPRGKRQAITPRSGITKQKGWPQYRYGMRPTLRGAVSVGI